MLLGNTAEYSAAKNWYFTSTECLCVRKPTSCTVELYMTPVKTGKWLFSVFQFPCSIRPALFLFSLQRDRRSQGFLILTSLSFSLSLVLFQHFSSLFCHLTSLFHSPSLLSYFLVSALSCALQSTFCFLLLVFLVRSASPPSSQLSCSGIVPDHWTSKYLLLMVALCSPHLDHVILKSEGTALLFSMSACSQRRKKRQRAGEGKTTSPTAKPAR